MDEKRAHRRQLMRAVAQIGGQAPDDWQPMILLDLSGSGVSFTHATPLAEGEQRTIRFNIPESNFLHEVTIQVVHSSTAGVPSGYRVGATFVSLQDASKQAIVDFLEKSLV